MADTLWYYYSIKLNKIQAIFYVIRKPVETLLFFFYYDIIIIPHKRKGQLESEKAFRISIFGLSKICVVTNGDTDAGVSSFEDTPFLINPSVSPFGNTERRRIPPTIYPTHRKWHK